MSKQDHIQAACQMGREAAEAAASWVTDGNESDESRRHKLALIEAGDPEAFDVWLPPAPNLSGEWAGDLNPRSLFEQVTGWDAHAEATWSPDAFGAYVDELCDAFEAGVSETFEAACEAELRRWIGGEDR